MKMQEFITQVKMCEEEGGNWYAKREVGLYDLYSDYSEAIENEYVENISMDRPSGNTIRVYCEDGYVVITKEEERLFYQMHAKRKRQTSYHRPASHYERTKAMVYATGNKWAIENFEATHC